MAACIPPLPPEMIEFAEGGRSCLIGTCGADLMPEAVRGVGVRIWPGAEQLTVLVPASTGARTVENARATGRVAVTLSMVETHETIQIKGTVFAVREGGPDERARAERYRSLLTAALGFVGQPTRNIERLRIWPCWALDVRIEQVFGQTPGPHAGEPMSAATARP